MKRLPILSAAVLVLVLLVAGCGSSGSSSSSSSTSNGTGGAPPASKGGKESATAGAKVSYVSPVAAQPGQKLISLGVERGAEELGWTSQMLDSALSPEKQISAVETAINQGDSAITSWTLDPHAAAGAYESAQAKGIPVIGMNSKGPGVTSTVWWENQLCEPGGPQEVTAKMISEMAPHAKTIMIVFTAAESTRVTGECFAKGAKKYGLDVINETNNEADTAAGSQKVIEPLLTKYPEVEAIFCYNDESALGASAALLAAGKSIATTENPEGVIVTGQNGDKGAIEAVQENRMTLTWDPDNLASGFAAVVEMNEALEGKKPKDLVIKSQLVDAETVGEYVPPEEREYSLDNLPLKE
ncbi:MAG TPA: sugar ABC transporter substrate-binding protein [Solirubrobacterales bacterium]